MQGLRIYITGFMLLVIVVCGLLLRLHNLSSFAVYPDSYQSLLVAQNIQTYHSVVGWLGKNGLLYPDFIAWTRPGYPLLIDALDLIIKNKTLAAQLISLSASVLGIVVSYLLGKKIGNSQSMGLACALLISFSFYHTVWSGFIMTEALGVLWMLSFLYFFLPRSSQISLANPWDFLSGVLLALAFMTRYEYIVFSLPITFFLFYQNPRPYIRLINIASSFLLTTAIIFSQLFPLQSFFSFLLYQLHGLFLKGIILVILTVIVFVLIRSMSLLKKKVVSYSSQAVIIFLWILIGLMLLSSFFSILSQYIPINLSFFRKFFFHDFVICTFSCVGLMFFLRKREYKVYGFFVILSCLLLGYVYYQVNPEMDRYMTHLLPFLLIPASYTLMLTYRKAYALLVSRQYVKGGGIVTALFCLIFLQGILTMYGLRYLHDTSWYHTSYETIAATKVKPYVTSDSIILVSLPEPYYYTLHISTQSITDTYPFVYIPKSLDNNTILVVDDMGMHTVFPHFEKFISQYLSPYTVTQFWVHEKFHYVNQSYKEKYPVTIYRIKLKQLKQLIHQNNLIK